MPNPPAPSSALKARSVLVIDDSDIDRQVMVDLLTQSGFTVHELPTPIGATRKARELQVAAVVIDQNLPSLDGGKLATLFRSAGMKELRVILVSSSDELTMLDITRRANADAFVNKRSLQEELVPTLRRLLRD
jgi:two-component system, sensor histidine kinase and response regulator